MGLHEKTIGTVSDSAGGRSAKLIPWIDHLLEKWARWGTAQGWHGGGCGISSLLMTEHHQIDRAISQQGGPDDVMLAVDTAVLCLPDELQQVVRQRYQGRGTMEQKATALGMNRMLFQRRLVSVHVAVQAALDKGVAAVPLLAPKYLSTRKAAQSQRQPA